VRSFSTRWFDVPSAHTPLALSILSAPLLVSPVVCSKVKQGATMETVTCALALNTSHTQHTYHGDAEEVVSC
jgi:hypothetical protein